MTHVKPSGIASWLQEGVEEREGKYMNHVTMEKYLNKNVLKLKKNNGEPRGDLPLSSKLPSLSTAGMQGKNESFMSSLIWNKLGFGGI